MNERVVPWLSLGMLGYMAPSSSLAVLRLSWHMKTAYLLVLAFYMAQHNNNHSGKHRNMSSVLGIFSHLLVFVRQMLVN